MNTHAAVLDGEVIVQTERGLSDFAALESDLGDIALELLVERALDKNDQRLLRLMTKRVAVERGASRSRAGAVRPLAFWEPIPPPRIDLRKCDRPGQKKPSPRDWPRRGLSTLDSAWSKAHIKASPTVP